jgi:hypothetical protein
MNNIHQNLNAHVKKQAKKLKKSNPDSQYSQCLEQIAKDLGYRNLHDLQQQDKSPNPVALRTNKLITNKSLEIIKQIMAESLVCETPYCEPNIDKREVIPFKPEFANLPGIHLYTKEQLVELFCELLLKKIDSSSDLHHIEWLCRRAIDKEIIKEFGHALQNNQEKEKKAIGYTLVALSHYYRSLMDNCAFKIAEHINFEQYFGYWLHSMWPHDDSDKVNSEVIMELKGFYPLNDLCASSGATNWAPHSWLKKQGRT